MEVGKGNNPYTKVRREQKYKLLKVYEILMFLISKIMGEEVQLWEKGF